MIFVTNDEVMGNNIRCLREQENLSLEELARRLGISASDLNAIETGANREIQSWILDQIFDFFSTDIQTLVEKSLENTL